MPWRLIKSLLPTRICWSWHWPMRPVSCMTILSMGSSCSLSARRSLSKRYRSPEPEARITEARGTPSAPWTGSQTPGAGEGDGAGGETSWSSRGGLRIPLAASRPGHCTRGHPRLGQLAPSRRGRARAGWPPRWRGAEQGRQGPEHQPGLVVGHGGHQGQGEAGRQQHRVSWRNWTLSGWWCGSGCRSPGAPQPFPRWRAGPQDVGVLGDHIGWATEAAVRQAWNLAERSQYCPSRWKVSTRAQGQKKGG